MVAQVATAAPTTAEVIKMPDIVEVIKCLDDGGDQRGTRETLLHYHHLLETLSEDLATRDRKIAELGVLSMRLAVVEASCASKNKAVDALVVQVRYGLSAALLPELSRGSAMAGWACF